jgi:hypothetical protein
MANPITWQNVTGGGNTGHATASRILDTGSKTLMSGLDGLAAQLQEAQGRTVDDNTQAFKDHLNSFRTPKDLQAAQKSGDLVKYLESFGDNIDRNVARTGADTQLNSLRDRETSAYNHEETLLDRVLKPKLSEIEAANATGDTRTRDQITEDFKADLLSAGKYGQVQQSAVDSDRKAVERLEALGTQMDEKKSEGFLDQAITSNKSQLAARQTYNELSRNLPADIRAAGFASIEQGFDTRYGLTESQKAELNTQVTRDNANLEYRFAQAEKQYPINDSYNFTKGVKFSDVKSYLTSEGITNSRAANNLKEGFNLAWEGLGIESKDPDGDLVQYKNALMLEVAKSLGTDEDMMGSNAINTGTFLVGSTVGTISKKSRDVINEILQSENNRLKLGEARNEYETGLKNLGVAKREELTGINQLKEFLPTSDKPQIENAPVSNLDKLYKETQAQTKDELSDQLYRALGMPPPKR